MGLEMEFGIGLFAAFAAYLLAGLIKDNAVFKCLVAFGYSFAPLAKMMGRIQEKILNLNSV